MKIAIMGFRGIPARYGGFETFIDELATRLVQRGHEVTVYGRSNIIRDYHTGDYYKGVKLVILPTISHKYLDTVVHTFLSVIHCLFCRYNVVLMLNAANSPLALIPRLTGKKVVLNVDGIERLRKKWNWIGKLYYRLGEYLATKFPNIIVTDAEVIRKYYLKTYKKESVMIPYGADIKKVNSKNMLERFNLQPNSYILYVSRLEPENNAHIAIKAFKKIKTKKNLVIVGDAPYAKKYINSLKKTKDTRIIFTGFVFGQGYKEFQSHAYCYIHATEVGGTHPALIESMGFGNCVIANGTQENIEVLGETGLIYKKNSAEDLKRKIQFVIDNPQVIGEFGKRAQKRVEKEYNWDSVADKYEQIFLSLIRSHR